MTETEYELEKGTIKPKEPLLALALTMLFTGLGQLYARRFKRGFFIMTAFLLGQVPTAYLMLDPDVTYSMATVVVFLLVFFGVMVLVWIDAFRCAREFNRRHNVEPAPGKLKYVLFVGFIVLLRLPGTSPDYWFALLTKEYIVEAFRNPTSGMEPTVKAGDRLLASKLAYRKSGPQRGDVVVFKAPYDPNINLLKRVVGLYGERLEIKDGGIYIDGEPAELPPPAEQIHYLNADSPPYKAPADSLGRKGQEVTVPTNSYFVLGDNSEASYDSRFFGFVQRENIVARAFKIYWPPERSGPIR